MGWRGPYLGRAMPRRFLSHKGVMGTAFRTHYASLEESYGPFSTELQRQAAADAAQYHCVKLLATQAWEQAQVTRTTGKGRRPNQSAVIRLAKRMALESQSYQLAVNRLRELTPKAEGHRDLSHLLTPSRSGAR